MGFSISVVLPQEIAKGSAIADKGIVGELCTESKTDNETIEV